MHDSLLMGMGPHLVPVPRAVWQHQMGHETHDGAGRLAFMSADHHRVRDLAVLDLPRAGRPLPPEYFAERLDLPLDRVQAILDDLEKHLTFLFRNPRGEVTWAYPVTVDATPHRLTFSTGERLYAA